MPERRDKQLSPADAKRDVTERSTAGDVDAFLQRVAAMPRDAKAAGTRGRLLFCLDATASREPTWDQACHIQGEMFIAAETLGGLEVKLGFYRGFDELKVSGWTASGSELARLMGKVRCLAGQTQLGRMLDYATEESRRRKVDAVVFVGDCFEENIDAVGQAAGRLALLGTPVFVFHEGFDQTAERAFRHVVRLTKGAYVRFDLASAGELKRLLGAVAAYAAGGRQAMLAYGQREGGAALRLTQQLG
jgi:hypothetical protein